MTNYYEKAKSPYDSPDIHVARCWFEGFETVLKKNGYTITKEQYESEME